MRARARPLSRADVKIRVREAATSAVSRTRIIVAAWARVSKSLLAVGDDLVDEAVLFSLHRGHDSVALNVALDLIEGLARVLRDDPRSQFAHANYLLGLNLYVRSLSADAARDGGLVDEYAR